MSDAELLTRWQSGDRRAGGELARRYFPVLRSYFLTKASVHYEDLVSNTMLRLVSKHEVFRGDSSFRVFVFGIARNILFEHFRALKRDAIFAPMEHSVADLEVGGVATFVCEQERYRLLFEALRRIPLEQQELLELYYFQEFKVVEIAALRGMPAPTLGSRVHAARRRLAAAYVELVDEPHARDFDEYVVESWLKDMRSQLDQVRVEHGG